MPKYTVEVSETRAATVEVEAASRHEAEEVALFNWDGGYETVVDRFAYAREISSVGSAG